MDEIILKYVPDHNIKNDLVDFNRIYKTDFRTVNGIEKVLELSDFRKRQIQIENIDSYYRDEEEWIESRWHTAFRMYFEELSETNYKHFVKEIVESLQDYKENGKLKITISAIFTKAYK